jgi:rhodanese-related sulfurtransferase
MEPIAREQVRMMTERGARLVEVLSQEAFRKFHVPDAISVPLDESFDESIQKAIPDKYDTVIVYCQNEDCNASTKAAQRMEGLGYENVYDYEGGKDDWKTANLPTE